jgi:hypothetical protein
MMKFAVRCALLSAVALGVPCLADEKKDKPVHPLVGTWKCVSAKYDGKEAARPDGYTQLKHVTPTHFIWVLHDGDGKVVAGMGGTCTMKGEEYIETPDYYVGDGFEALKGKAQEFKWKVDGKKWIHNGKLSSATTVEEVWERVGGKDD